MAIQFTVVLVAVVRFMYREKPAVVTSFTLKFTFSGVDETAVATTLGTAVMGWAKVTDLV